MTKEVVPIPYRFCGRCAMRLGVEFGMRQICFVSRASCLSSVAIWGREKGATWNAYVIYGTMTVWSICSLFFKEAGEHWSAVHFSLTLRRVW